ncbi:MAG: hypothetical protein KY445_01730 [Armatimonadetes bacterium]|nr:hypothetical protein [Armatimonadota bacterium]
MKHTFDGEEFEIFRGSDIIHDGMYLEARRTSIYRERVLVAFFSDETGKFTFSAYREDLPFELVEAFVTRAREQLPPHQEDK